MKSKLYNYLLSNAFCLPTTLISQKFKIEASFLIGSLSSEKLNGMRAVVYDKNTLPSVILDIYPTSFKKTFSAFCVKGTRNLFKNLHFGTYVSYTHHKFGFEYTSSRQNQEVIYFANHLLNIQKIGVGIEPIFMLKYIDVGLMYGIEFNTMDFEHGWVKSSEHFKLNDLNSKMLRPTINHAIGINIQFKLPIHKKGELIGGFQLIEHLNNKVTDILYEFTYTSKTFHFGYRFHL